MHLQILMDRFIALTAFEFVLLLSVTLLAHVAVFAWKEHNIGYKVVAFFTSYLVQLYLINVFGQLPYF